MLQPLEHQRIELDVQLSALSSLTPIGTMHFMACEKRIERESLSSVYGSSYNDCMDIHSINPHIVALDEMGKPILRDEQEEIILDAQSIMNKVNWDRFLYWAKEQMPLWFSDVSQGMIVQGGTRKRLEEKMFVWECQIRDGVNREKVEKLIHPNQLKLLRLYIHHTVNYWILRNKLEAMSSHDIGFSNEYVYQEVKRIINFNKVEVPQMYRSVNKTILTNLTPIIEKAFTGIIKEALLSIDQSTTDEKVHIIASVINARIDVRSVIQEEHVKVLARGVVEELSQQMHRIFVVERPNIVPELEMPPQLAIEIIGGTDKAGENE